MSRGEYVDQVAVDRAVAGDLGTALLNTSERRAAIRELHRRGYCDRDIAERVHCATETVQRIRKLLGLPRNFDDAGNPVHAWGRP